VSFLASKSWRFGLDCIFLGSVIAQKNYFEHICWMPRPKTETIAFLTADETARLFHELGDHKRNKAIFLLAYRHGLRASEVGLLQRSDLDFKKLRIMLHRLKGSYSGEHPLQPDEAKAIKAYLRNRDHESPFLFISNRGDPQRPATRSGTFPPEP
jgi:integrase